MLINYVNQQQFNSGIFVNTQKNIDFILQLQYYPLSFFQGINTIIDFNTSNTSLYFRQQLIKGYSKRGQFYDKLKGKIKGTLMSQGRTPGSYYYLFLTRFEHNEQENIIQVNPSSLDDVNNQKKMVNQVMKDWFGNSEHTLGNVQFIFLFIFEVTSLYNINDFKEHLQFCQQMYNQYFPMLPQQYPIFYHPYFVFSSWKSQPEVVQQMNFPHLVVKVEQNNPNIQWVPDTGILPLKQAENDGLNQKIETSDYGKKFANATNGKKQILRGCNKNVLPNNIHLVLSYIRRINKSGLMVKKIISKMSQNGIFTTKNFYSYQVYLKDKLTNCKHIDMIQEIVTHLDQECQVFTLAEQKFYNMVNRILIHDFLKAGAVLNVLTSAKINKTNKAEHLKVLQYMDFKLSIYE